MTAPHQRDARPFVAHHLRARANARSASNGAALHGLARWVENLPARHPHMRRIEATGALGYEDARFTGGEPSERLIDAYAVDGDAERERWLDDFSTAVQRFWSDAAEPSTDE